MGAELKPCPFEVQALTAILKKLVSIKDFGGVIDVNKELADAISDTKQLRHIVANSSRPTESALRKRVEGLEGEVERLSRWNLEPEEADSGGK